VPSGTGWEEKTDWHGASLAAALQRVRSITGVRFCAEVKTESLVLGRLFWQCLLKGGAQGGIYCIDTIRACRRRGHRWAAAAEGGKAPC